MLNYIHIAKTGGTAVKHALRARPDLEVAMHQHVTSLNQIPSGQPIFFTIRHPVDRFISGFNSRLRRGQPRHDVAWTEGEERAFTAFQTPNALAEGLSAEDDDRRAAAEAAMTAISHALPVTYWLQSPESLAARESDIAMICDIRSLNADVSLLSDMMGWDPKLELSENPVVAHATPDGFETKISITARRNLLSWYEEDLLIYGAARAIREKILLSFKIRSSGESSSGGTNT